MKIFKRHIPVTDLILTFLVVTIGVIGGFTYRLSDSAWLIRLGLKSRPIHILIASRALLPEKIEEELRSYLNVSLVVREFDPKSTDAAKEQEPYDLIIAPFCLVKDSASRMDWRNFSDLRESLSPDFQGLLEKAPHVLPLLWRSEGSMQLIGLEAANQSLMRSMMDLFLNPQFLRYWARETGYQTTLNDPSDRDKFRSFSLRQLTGDHPLGCLESGTKK